MDDFLLDHLSWDSIADGLFLLYLILRWQCQSEGGNIQSLQCRLMQRIHDFISEVVQSLSHFRSMKQSKRRGGKRSPTELPQCAIIFFNSL